MRVLATGISGFVGPHLVAELLAHGHEVHGLFLDEREPVPAGVSGVHHADITDIAAVERVVATVAPEWVMHLAGVSSVGQSFADPVGTWRVNLWGTLAILEACRAQVPAARCLTVTSGEMYGYLPPDGLPVTPETPVIPRSPYGASKAAADLAGVQYRLGFGLPVLRVRAFNHIGPGQDPRFVVPSVARQIALAERDRLDHLTIEVGNVETRRDFSDVRDIVRAYRLVVERGDPEVAYLACSGRSTAIADLIAVLVAHSRVPASVVTDATRVREGEQPDLYGSHDRLTADTGWTPEIPLERSLTDTLDWWRERVAQEDR